MPRLNAKGQALMGVGDGILSLDRVRIYEGLGGASCWYDDETPIASIRDARGGYSLALYLKGGMRPIPLTDGATFLAAGGNRYQAYLATAPSRCEGALGELPGAGLCANENEGVAAAGRDGTLAFMRNQQNGLGFVLAAPGVKPDRWFEYVKPVRDLQVLGPRMAIWTERQQIHVTPTLAAPAQIAPAWRPRYARVDDTDWIVYWTEVLGLIAHPFTDPSRGYVIQPGDRAYNHDAVGLGHTLRVAFSVTQGEGPDDLRVIDRSPGKHATVDLAALLGIQSPFRDPPATTNPTPPATPSPIPPRAPEPHPMSLPDPKAALKTVERIRARWPRDNPGGAPLGDDAGWAIVEVAQAFGAKVFRKDGGDHAWVEPLQRFVSRTLIGQGALGNRYVKVFGDGEGSAFPIWNVADDPALGEYLDVSGIVLPGAPVIDPKPDPTPDPQPDPTPDPTPGPDLAPRVAALEAGLAAANKRIDDLPATLAITKKR